jgi:hypothetical protein
MPPRQRSRSTDIHTRLRNTRDAQGRVALGGLTRIGGSARGRGTGSQQSVLANVSDPDAVGNSSGSAQLLVMSATAAEIAPGGTTVPFGTVVAQHGFANVPAASGGSWVHPVSGVYALTYEHAWAAFDGGGRIVLQLDGVDVPEGVIADGTVGQGGRGTIAYVAEAGQAGRIMVTHSAAAAQTCDALVRIAITDPKQADVVVPSSWQNVVSLGTQADPTVAAWVGKPSDWTDPDAEWIWHTALESNSRPNGEQAWLLGIYESVADRAVTIEAAADNTADVYLNGLLLGNVPGFDTRTTFSATLAAGRNRLAVLGTNGSGTGDNPAGVLISVADTASGAVLFRSTDDGGWYGWTSEPDGWPTP